MLDASVRLFQTHPHPCGYWPARVAQDLIVDPLDPHLASRYESLLSLGFRRSGGHIYRPRCPSCQACVPLRLLVRNFVASRRQRRCLARNADVELVDAPAERTTERFDLYHRYLRARHPDGGMDDSGPEEFDMFLRSQWSPTRFFELRKGDQLLAVGATDVLPNALSAVYTFFDPDMAQRGLGTLAVLKQIEWAAQTGRQYLYLGFWISDHPKMAYKASFAAAEVLGARGWMPLNSPEQT